MLTVTDAAFERLSNMMNKLSEGVSVRIVRQDDRTKITRGAQRPGDIELTHNEQVVLRFGDNVADRLMNKVLDVRQTQNGPRLGLRGKDGVTT